MKQAQISTISEIDFEPFESEKDYISPEYVEEEIIDRIRELPVRLATVEITH